MSKVTDKDAIERIHEGILEFGQPKHADHLSECEWGDEVRNVKPDEWLVQMTRRLMQVNSKLEEEQLAIPDVLTADEMNTIHGFNQGAEAVVGIIQRFPDIKSVLDLPFVMSEIERRAARLEKRLIGERE